jgi:ribose transport system permease protein
MKRWTALANTLGPVIGLILVFGFFALIGPESFASSTNMETIARQTAIVGTAALGMTLVIISGGIDLSVGSIIALVTVVIAAFQQAGFDPLTAALAGVAVGALCGFINGSLITRPIYRHAGNPLNRPRDCQGACP